MKNTASAQALLAAAREAGFAAGLITTDEIPTDPAFRKYCAENRCGQYDANYSCPPRCGSPGEMKERFSAFAQALVVHSVWDIDGYEDRDAIRAAKARHNEAMLTLCDRLRREGKACLMCGASHCLLCDRCAQPAGEPCRDEQRRYSCLSAYCVHVAGLAENAGLDFSWSDRRMNLYGLIAF